jgi:hypothetical protein
MELYLHSPSTPSWRGAELKKAQGQLYDRFCENGDQPAAFVGVLWNLLVGTTSLNEQRSII